MIRIDDKFIKNNLKKGWTTEDFAKHCTMSEEQFLSYLKTSFPKPFAEATIRDLKRNDKNQKKEKRDLIKRGQRISKETSSNGREEPTLESLFKKEKDLKDSLFEAEKKIAESMKKKHGIYQDLQKEKNFIEEILLQINRRSEIVDNFIKQIEEIDSRSATLKNSKAKLTNELKQVQSKIKTLRNLPICCFEDGRVECENLHSVDWSRKFQQLTADEPAEDASFMQIRELAEDLSIKQVRQLAKVLAIVEILETQGQKFNIQFEKENQISALLELVEFEVVY